MFDYRKTGAFTQDRLKKLYIVELGDSPYTDNSEGWAGFKTLKFANMFCWYVVTHTDINVTMDIIGFGDYTTMRLYERKYYGSSIKKYKKLSMIDRIGVNDLTYRGVYKLMSKPRLKHRLNTVINGYGRVTDSWYCNMFPEYNLRILE